MGKISGILLLLLLSYVTVTVTYLLIYLIYDNIHMFYVMTGSYKVIVRFGMTTLTLQSLGQINF